MTKRATLFAWLRFLIPLLLAAALVRGFVAVPRLVPSASMVPRLLPGDVILVWRPTYGWSRTSLPLGWRLWRGRVGGRAIGRGDLVVFESADGGDLVKRVVGLPGDRIAMRDGRLLLNGRLVPRTRIADLVVSPDAGLDCVAAGGSIEPEGCRLRRWREWLGTDVSVVTTTSSLSAPEVRVPADGLYVLGDNRDRSGDSRGAPPDGTGLVPIDAILGAVGPVIWSTGSSEGSWVDRVRWDRLGSVG